MACLKLNQPVHRQARRLPIFGALLNGFQLGICVAGN